MVRYATEPAIGVALSSGQQQDGAAEGGEQEDAKQSSVGIERVDPVERDRHEEAEPEDQVEHDGRTHPLGGETEGSG